MTLFDDIGWGAWVLLPVVLLVAAVVACFFRRGRRIVAWTVVVAVLLVAGLRLAREAAYTVHGRGWSTLERAGWRWVADVCPVWREGWSRTYEVGAEGMGRGWAGLVVWGDPKGETPESYRGKLRLEWVDEEGRTVRESLVGAEGPEGLAFSPPARERMGAPQHWTLPLEPLDTAWVAEREAADGLRLRMSVAEPDDRYIGSEKNLRQSVDFCIWLEK